MGIGSWLKRTLLDTVGVGMMLDAVSNFGGSLSMQDPRVRGAMYVALGLNDLSRGEISPEQAKSLVMTGLPETLPLEWIAGFAHSEFGQKLAVKGVQSVASGVLGLALGTDDRERAKQQIAEGIECFFPAPVVPPAPAPAVQSKG